MKFFFLFIFVTLFLVFARIIPVPLNINAWDVTKIEYYESWVGGTILKSRTSSDLYLFNARYIPKRNNKRFWSPANANFNYEKYKSKVQLIEEEGEWYDYKSALRSTTMLYVFTDHLLYAWKNEHQDNFYIFKYIASALSALCFSFLFLWIYKEFDIITTLTALTFLIFSPWIVSSASNLIRPIGLSFIPIISLFLYYYKKQHLITNFRLKEYLLIGFLTAISISIVASINYETIPTVMMSSLIPCIYYSIKLNANKLEAFKQLLLIGIASLVGFFTVLFLHFLIVAQYFNSLILAKEYFIQRFFFRTNSFGLTNKEWYHKQSFFEILQRYLHKEPIFFSFSADIIIGFTAILITATIALYYLNKSIDTQKIFALSVVVVWSLIGSIMNFLVFKAHAVIHPFIDHIWWCLPFSILVAVLIGNILSSLIISIKKNQSMILNDINK